MIDRLYFNLEGRKGRAAAAASCFLFVLMFTLMMKGQATRHIDRRDFDAILATFSTSLSSGKDDKGRRWNTELHGGRVDEDRGKAKENTSTTSQSKSIPYPKTKRNGFFLFYMQSDGERDDPLG